MIPSVDRLLFQIRKTLGGIRHKITDAEILSLLDSTDILLNEVALRQDHAFYQNQRQTGLQLLDRAVQLNLAQQAPGTVTTPDGNVFEIQHRLEAIVSRMPLELDEAEAEFIKRINAWEIAFYAHRLTERGKRASSRSAREITAEAFEVYLRHRFPDRPHLRVESFARLTGGFSKITILVDIHDDISGRQSIVIRAEPSVRIMEQDGLDIRREYPLVQLAYRAGLPVPEPLWLEDDAARLGLRFMVSRKAPGTNIGSLLAGSEPLGEGVLQKLAKLLATMARAPVRATPPGEGDPYILNKWRRYATLTESTRALVDYWRDQARIGKAGPSPIVQRGFDWLAANVPLCDDGPALVHGDMGLHNILFDKGEVAALLDWEAAFFGDPAMDVGSILRHAGAQAQEQDFLRAYMAYSGPAISAFRLRYFDVLHAVRMVLSTMVVLQRVEDYDEAHINWAVFGLRYTHGVAADIDRLIATAEAAKETV